MPGERIELAGHVLPPSAEEISVYSKKESAGIVPRHIPMMRAHNRHTKDMESLFFPEYMATSCWLKPLFPLCRKYIPATIFIIADFLFFAIIQSGRFSMKSKNAVFLVDFCHWSGYTRDRLLGCPDSLAVQMQRVMLWANKAGENPGYLP